jgi:hypothetical protein
MFIKDPRGHQVALSMLPFLRGCELGARETGQAEVLDGILGPC